MKSKTIWTKRINAHKTCATAMAHVISRRLTKCFGMDNNANEKMAATTSRKPSEQRCEKLEGKRVKWSGVEENNKRNRHTLGTTAIKGAESMWIFISKRSEI